MSHLRKAAILLMSLPEEDASALLAKLDSKLVEQVSIEIAKLQAISLEEQEAAIMDPRQRRSRRKADSRSPSPSFKGRSARTP